MSKSADLEIEYRYSSRRRSIALMVTPRGNLVVTSPRGTSPAQISQALARHRGWIEQKAAERREAWACLKEGTFYLLGRPYPLPSAGSQGKPGAPPGPEILELPDWPACGWPALKDWLSRQAAAHVQERLAFYAPALGVRARPLELSQWKRRWGECHPDGRLRFNWRLIMLPPEVIDYVVVHELAHLKVPGHNPRFWGQVEMILPDYRERRRWLNRYGTPFLWWEP
ncbi:MAG: SprT family zinc-dependent metalloprotease [Desulfobaccales bacterium]